MKARLETNSTCKRTPLKEEGNIRIEALYDIILTKSGKPDYLAIDIYTEARSWFKPKKTVIQGNVTYSSKLSGYGWQIGYEYLARKHKRSKDLIRTKLALLENLGLLTRDFRTEYYHGKRFNNNMYLLVWKDTPYFYSEIGLEKREATTPQNQGFLYENSSTPLLENKDNIYRIPNNKEREEEPLGYSSSLSPSIKTRVREAEVLPISESLFGEDSKKEPQKQTLTVPTLATGSMNEPAKVQYAKETSAELSYFPERQAVVPAATSLEVLAKEEGRHTQCHRNREPSTGLSFLQDIPLLTSLITPDPTENRVSENEPIKNDKEIISMKASQTPLEPERNMMLELSGAIFKNFGSLRSEEIMEHCKFNLIDLNKLSVQLSPGYALSATDKDSLKACIKSVYGEGINIVASAPFAGFNAAKPELQAPQLASLRHNHAMWEQFRKELLNFFPKNTGQHSLSAWFDKLSVKENKPDNTIILTGSSFYINYIYRSFTAAIEHAVKKNNVALELHFENNEERPIIYQPNGGF